MKKTFLFLLLAMLGAGSAKAQFSGGSGTEDDPYLIASEDDLYDISTSLSAHYKLSCDLDLTEWIQDENPKQGWEPIGTSVGHGGQIPVTPMSTSLQPRHPGVAAFSSSKGSVRICVGDAYGGCCSAWLSNRRGRPHPHEIL